MNDIKGIIEDVEKSDLVSDKVIKRVIETIGQEKWQDIHDEESDIYTTTGELIITLKGVSYLEKENTELKERYNKVDIIGYDALKNLTKATDLLKKMYYLYFDLCVTEQDLENRDKLFEEVKQFLKGENTILEDVQAGNSPLDADEVFNKEMKAYPEEKVK